MLYFKESGVGQNASREKKVPKKKKNERGGEKETEIVMIQAE